METCLVLLGKSGDLISALPIAWHHHKAGKVVNWVVSQQYFTVLLGASYVSVDKVHFHVGQSDAAMNYATQKYQNVINLTTWGKHWRGSRAMSYNREMYEHAGLGHLFHDLKALPLVFDRRDAQREAFIVKRSVPDITKPVMLLCIGCGKSSPFSGHHVFTEAIKRYWAKHFSIVDLCAVKAGRLFDLLGLFDSASLLITGDTAALHLSSAVPSLPVIALVNNSPFLGTTPRVKPLGLLRYCEATKRIGEVHGWVRTALLAQRSTAQAEKERESFASSQG